MVPERAAPVAAPVAAPDEDLPGDWPLDPAASHPPRAGQGAPDSLPRAIGWELPVYPETMRRLSRETVVRATFLVHKDGSVDGVRVVGPPEFAQAVEQAILRTRFVPAMRDGRPVAHGLSVVFRFRLTGAGVAISPE